MTALQSIVAAWLALGLVLVGLGVLVQRGFGARPRDGDAWLLAFWLGWVAAVCVLQLWQLAFPVDDRVRAGLAVAGALGLVAAGGAGWRVAARGTMRHVVAVFAVAVVAAWLAQRALGGPQNGDSGFYHIPTVRWFLTYPVVPGLANLFAALAYNQSYFLYVAMLDAGPFAHRSHHLANAILVVVLFARAALGLSRVLRAGAGRPVDLFYALMLPATACLVFDINLTSPSPDVTVYALWIVLSGQLLALVARPVPRAADLLALALLAGAAVTVKLSLAGLAAAIVPVAAAVWLRRARPAGAWMVGGLAAVGVALAVTAVPWMVRGLYLSGYPLYPSPIGGLAAEWSAPHAAVVAEADLIRYWNGVRGWWWALLLDPGWFARWLVTLGWLERDVLVPLAIAAAAGLLAVVARVRHRRSSGPRVPAVVLLPTLAGLAFCFVAAPRARYGSAGFWVLAAQTTLLAVFAGAAQPARWRRLVPVVVAVALAAVPFTDGKPLLRDLTDFEMYPRPVLHEERLATGLVVYVPGETMCCWDGPFPCTPYPNQALRLRRDGDLAAGFMIDPTVPPPAHAGP